jgi:hypothetical protein
MRKWEDNRVTIGCGELDIESVKEGSAKWGMIEWPKGRLGRGGRKERKERSVETEQSVESIDEKEER